MAGCPLPPTTGGGAAAPAYNNTSDPTNQGAAYIGSAACSACHASEADQHRVHGHARALNRVQGTAPSYPPEGTRAGVPVSPTGSTWADIAYVVGGYTKMGQFVDRNGYVMVTGVLGVSTQWNLNFPANGTLPGFTPYEPSLRSPQAYDYDCFRCHTTGPQRASDVTPTFQDNRPGMRGTFAEPSAMCEACHGPGSNHVPNPSARLEYVSSDASLCGRCHVRDDDPNVILASGGFIRNNQQWSELLASGGHRGFACTVCHDPHVSVNYAAGIRNDCAVCHPDKTLGFHEGVIFVRGDFVEPLECESCHMPYATTAASTATAATVGATARVGDTRTHIFRINTGNVDYQVIFSVDGSRVAQDANGQATITLDFVCLRCHNGVGNAFELRVKSAAEIAPNIHAVQSR